MHFWCEGFGLSLGLRLGSGACSQGLELGFVVLRLGLWSTTLNPKP